MLHGFRVVVVLPPVPPCFLYAESYLRAQLLLVALDKDEIVTLAPHYGLDGLLLAVHGIGGDDAATDVKFLHELLRCGNLIALLRHAHLPEGQPVLHRIGTDDTQGGTVCRRGRPEFLAIDGNYALSGFPATAQAEHI